MTDRLDAALWDRVFDAVMYSGIAVTERDIEVIRARFLEGPLALTTAPATEPSGESDRLREALVAALSDHRPRMVYSAEFEADKLLPVLADPRVRAALAPTTAPATAPFPRGQVYAIAAPATEPSGERDGLDPERLARAIHHRYGPDGDVDAGGRLWEERTGAIRETRLRDAESIAAKYAVLDTGEPAGQWRYGSLRSGQGGPEWFRELAREHRREQDTTSRRHQRRVDRPLDQQGAS